MDIELRTEDYNMFFEGTSTTKPSEEDIRDFILDEGYEVTSVNIEFDNMMGFYRILGNIRR